MKAKRLSRVAASLILAVVTFIATGFVGSAMADEIVAPTGTPIVLDVRKGTLVRVQEPLDTVFVADPNIADIQIKSPTLLYVFAKRVGDTVLYGVTEDERVIISRTIMVTHNLMRLQAALDQFLPGSSVRAASMDGSLVLEGDVSSPAHSADAQRIAASFVAKPEQIVNRLNVTGPNQVNLRVKIAEISRDIVKEFGVNWESILSNGAGYAFGIGAGRDFLNGATVLRDQIADSVLFSYTADGIDLNVLIDALEDENLGQILAEPNLTALSGETARFLAGGEFPIPVSQDEDTISIVFKEFGVALAFTPTILTQERINLRVSPEVSQITDVGAVETDGFSIPALTTRRAETTVELGSGQSFAIAGLLQNNIDETVRKFPGLGDIPVLGRLFRSEEFTRNETELVIVVTPYIVRPVSTARLSDPTQGFTPPNDKDRFWQGKMYQQQTGSRPQSPVAPHGTGLTGPAGFILD